MADMTYNQAKAFYKKWICRFREIRDRQNLNDPKAKSIFQRTMSIIDRLQREHQALMREFEVALKRYHGTAYGIQH